MFVFLIHSAIEK